MDNIITPKEYMRILKGERDLLCFSGSLHEIEVQYTPSEKTVNSILSYSKALSCRKTQCGGYIEMILN